MLLPRQLSTLTSTCKSHDHFESSNTKLENYNYDKAVEEDCELNISSDPSENEIKTAYDIPTLENMYHKHVMEMMKLPMSVLRERHVSHNHEIEKSEKVSCKLW